MSKTVGQFDYSITQLRKADDQLPFHPFVVLCLKQWGVLSAESPPTISTQLLTADEIDFHIRRLKEDLDAVGESAKRALKKATAATRVIVSSRDAL